jgi:hypothetical protein
MASLKWTAPENEPEIFSSGDAKFGGSKFVQELERNKGRHQTTGNQEESFPVTILYLNQPGYGHEIKYTSVEADPSIKKGLFKRSGSLRELRYKQ